MRRRTRARIAIGATLAVALSGCSRAEDPGPAAAGEGGGGGPEKPPPPVAAVAAAAERLKSTESFTSTISVRTVLGGKAREGGRGRATYRTRPEFAYEESMGSGADRAVIRIGDDFYLRVGADSPTGKPWSKLSMAEMRRSDSVDAWLYIDQAQVKDPLLNTRLLTTSKDVAKVGREPVNAVPATRYQGTYDRRQAMARIDPVTRKAPSVYRLERVTFDLWVDDQRMPRKLAYEATMNSPVVGRGKIAVTMELGDFGAPASIVPPPARQTAGE